MRTAIALSLALVGLAACSKSPPANQTSGTTTLTGGSASRAPASEDIRMLLLQSEPNHPELAAFDITNDDGRVTVRGVAPDERTHQDIVKRVKAMPNVKDVKDEVRVATPSSTTEAVRTAMKRDHPNTAAVVDELVISDDGSTLLIEGVVPDDATHDALLQSAEGASSGKSVQDKTRVSAK
jgi:osmotically-inducible protein OsmY